MKYILFASLLFFLSHIKAQHSSHDTWNNILKNHVSEDGNVDYKNLKINQNELTKYINYLGKNIPSKDSAKNEKLAYWINAYNALTIDLILRHYPVKSIKDIKNPWDQKLWTLGKTTYSLNEIEHDILRKMGEPRIHFAIVCASYSCPKLQNEAFTASRLEQQLNEVTTAFLSDPEQNKISEKKLELSKIFKWFRKDFEQNGSLIDFINQYTETAISKDAKINYKDYHWALNE